MTIADEFAIGMRVMVPWGLDEVEGEVEAVQGAGPEARLAISLVLPDADAEESETLVLPARLVKPLDPSKERDPNGYWLEAYRYWEELSDSVKSLLESPGSTVGAELHLAGDRSDIVVTTPEGVRLIIEAKAARKIGESDMKSIISQIRRLTEDLAGRTSALVVLRSSVSPELAARFAELASSESAIPIELTTWRGHHDDDELRTTLRRLTATG